MPITSCSSCALLLGLLVVTPAFAAGQARGEEGRRPAPIQDVEFILRPAGVLGIVPTLADAVFWVQLEAAQEADDASAEATAPAAAAVNPLEAVCAAILAGPRRDQALRSGDCAEVLDAGSAAIAAGETDDGLGSGLVTITPEPATLALLAIPMGLVMVGLLRRRSPLKA